MIAAKQLEDTQRDRVHEVLLSRHRHQHDKGSSKGLPIIRSLADIGRKTSDRKLEGKGAYLRYYIVFAVIVQSLYCVPQMFCRAELDFSGIQNYYQSGYLSLCRSRFLKKFLPKCL